jgi:hypothetical protein
MTHTDRFSGANHRGYPAVRRAAAGSFSCGACSGVPSNSTAYADMLTGPAVSEALAMRGFYFSESGSDGDHISGATAHGFGNGITQSGRNRT